MGNSLLLDVKFPLIWLFLVIITTTSTTIIAFFFFNNWKFVWCEFLSKFLMYLNMYKNYYPISFWGLNQFSPFSFFVNVNSITIYLEMSYPLLQFRSMKSDFGIPLAKCVNSLFCKLFYNNYLLRWMGW